MVPLKIISYVSFFSVVFFSCKIQYGMKNEEIKSSCYDTLYAISIIRDYSMKKFQLRSDENLLIDMGNCDSNKAISRRINFGDYQEPNIWYCDTAFYVNVRNLENNKVLNLILDCRTCNIKPFPKIHKIHK
jgi:hypothetical protein